MRVTCDKCGKYTWKGECKAIEYIHIYFECIPTNYLQSAGCGLHIEQALAGLTEDQKCKCKKD